MNEGDGIQIPIVTTADTSGAKQQAAAIEKVSQAAKELNSAQAKVSTETSAAGKVAQEAGKKWEFLGQRKSEVKKLVRELGQEFPLAAQAIRAAMNPMLALISLAIGAFIKMKEAIDQWNAEMDEAAKRAANPEFKAGIDAKAEALRQGAISSREFSESLHAAGKSEDQFLRQIDLAIAKFHEYVAAQAEVNSAAEAKELADINAAEKLGKLTPEQAISRRAAVRGRFAKTDADLKTEGENKELAAKEAALQHVSKEAPSLERDALLKKAAADALSARLAASKASLPGAEESLKQYQGEVNARGQRLGVLQGGEGNYFDAISSGLLHLPKGIVGDAATRAIHEYNLEHATRKYEESVALRDKQLRLISGYKEDIDTIPTALLPGAVSEQKIAEERARSAVAKRLSLEGDIANQKATLPIRQRGRALTLGLKQGAMASDEMAQLASTPVGESLAGASAAADAILSGRKSDDATRNWILQLGRLLTNQTTTMEQAIKLISTSNDSLQNFKRDLDLLKQRMSNVDSRSRNNTGMQ